MVSNAKSHLEMNDDWGYPDVRKSPYLSQFLWATCQLPWQLRNRPLEEISSPSRRPREGGLIAARLARAVRAREEELPVGFLEAWHDLAEVPIWLVVWLPWILFSHILGISSSQLTHIFQKGSNHQPAMLSNKSTIYVFMVCTVYNTHLQKSWGRCEY